MITLFSALDPMSAECAALFAAGGQRSFHCTETWFRISIAHALPTGMTPYLALYAERGEPLVLFPLQMHQARGALSSLTNVYTCLWQPLMGPGYNDAVMRRAGRAFARICRAWPTVRLDAMDDGLPEMAQLLNGIRDGGLVVQRFEHFGNWYQSVAGWSWQDYLESRPGSLRETIRRKVYRGACDANPQFELVTGLGGLEAGIDAYERVYAGSWKGPEPFPCFNPALMRAAADLGVLRLGVLRQGGQPVAAQYWIVANGSASILKLAHLEAAKKSSPGTVLTALMIRWLLDEEHVRELDFGRGDDPYKQIWTGERRQRIGLMLMNPRYPSGLLSCARYLTGRACRGLVRLGARA